MVYPLKLTCLLLSLCEKPIASSCYFLAPLIWRGLGYENFPVSGTLRKYKWSGRRVPRRRLCEETNEQLSEMEKANVRLIKEVEDTKK
jgi:hypothetical protein